MDSASEQKRLYDAACKQVLSERGIVAHILKTCATEYENVAVEDIRDKYICGQPEVGATIVENTQVEDSSVDEGTVRYDVRFNALAPQGDGLITLIINIEAQNNFNPGYPLHKRATYYCARMLSSQYGSVFTKSHYEKLKKVYSIWVCTNPAKEWEYSITRYRINEEPLVGSSRAEQADYDLLTYVMVCLGHKRYTELTGLLRMLNYVMLDSDGFEAKRTRLIEEFAIEMTPHLEEGVASMCNLSEGVEARGVEKGIASVVLNMLRLKRTVAEIALLVGWSIDKVRSLARENNIPITE